MPSKLKKNKRKSSYLPKGYLSPSSISLLLKNEEAWVKKYIYGEESETTRYMSLGRETADFTDDDIEISCTLKRNGDELVLKGKLDGYKNGVQYENKTSTKCWTQKQVDNSIQLKIYALIHYKNTGKIPKQELTWCGTKLVDGELVITGEHKPFYVHHTLTTILETQVLCWRAYDRALELVERELNKI